MFLDHAILEHVFDRGLWILQQPLRYQLSAPVGTLATGTIITVVPPFTTDLGTIPRFGWILIPRSDRHIVEPSVLHDYLYRSNLVTRKEADLLLRQAVKSCGGPTWYCYLVWAAVRLFGHSLWVSDHKKAGAAK